MRRRTLKERGWGPCDRWVIMSVYRPIIRISWGTVERRTRRVGPDSHRKRLKGANKTKGEVMADEKIDELVKRVQDMLEAEGFKDHILAFIVPENEERKTALALAVHMTRFNALHVLNELADKMPDVFSSVVIHQMEKMKAIDPKSN